MFNVHVSDEPAQLSVLAPEWDGLWSHSSSVDICATAGFARAWWRAYGFSRTLQLFTVRDGSGHLRLVAPLYYDHDFPTTLKIIGNFRADFCNFVAAHNDHESVSALLGYLRRSSNWRLLSLDNVPSEAELLRPFSDVPPLSTRSLNLIARWLLQPSPTLALRDEVRIHPYIGRERIVALKNLIEERSYRKHLTWFQKRGRLEYVALRAVDDIRLKLDEFMDLHVREWTVRRGRSFFLDSENRLFYHSLVDEFHGYDAIRLHLLSLDGRMIAAHFGFETKNRIYYYKPCYEPDFSQHSPGRLLLAYILRDAADSAIETVELLYGLEDYKLALTDQIRKTSALRLYRSKTAWVHEVIRERLS